MAFGNKQGRKRTDLHTVENHCIREEGEKIKHHANLQVCILNFGIAIMTGEGKGEGGTT